MREREGQSHRHCHLHVYNVRGLCVQKALHDKDGVRHIAASQCAVSCRGSSVLPLDLCSRRCPPEAALHRAMVRRGRRGRSPVEPLQCPKSSVQSPGSTSTSLGEHRGSKQVGLCSGTARRGVASTTLRMTLPRRCNKPWASCLPQSYPVSTIVLCPAPL